MVNKNVIFYAPSFYGYGNYIQKKIEKSGFRVYRISHNKSRIMDFFISFISNNRREKIYASTLMSELKRIPVSNCNVFFVIKGDYLSLAHIQYLKSINPSMFFVMYQWDSIEHFNYDIFINVFDKIYTFDFKDAENYKLNYLPLFYLDDIYPTTQDMDIDLLFVATNAPWRYSYLKRLKKISKEYDLKLYVALKNPFSSFIKDLLCKQKYYSLNDVRFFSVGRGELLSLYRRSKVFVDITNPLQTGLSMRIIECYGMNKKLITSNKNVNSDKYIEDIDYIFSDSSDDEILEFVNRPFVDYKNREKLSIDAWLHNILGK